MRCLAGDAIPRGHSSTSALRRRTSITTTMKPVIAVPAIAALVYRAYSKKSLTPVGIFTAFVTAVIHVIHPWSVFFTLLAVFFLAGSTVTKASLIHESLSHS